MLDEIIVKLNNIFIKRMFSGVLLVDVYHRQIVVVLFVNQNYITNVKYINDNTSLNKHTMDKYLSTRIPLSDQWLRWHFTPNWALYSCNAYFTNSTEATRVRPLTDDNAAEHFVLRGTRQSFI